MVNEHGVHGSSPKLSSTLFSPLLLNPKETKSVCAHTHKALLNEAEVKNK